MYADSDVSNYLAQNNIFMKTKQLEELKSQMNWDQKALEAWLEESAKRDEDALILEKYTRSDESKVKVNHFIIDRNKNFGGM